MYLNITPQMLSLVSCSKTRERDPQIGLFIMKYALLEFHPITTLEQCDGPKLIKKMCEILNSIDGIRNNYNDDRDQWYIEFGTKPIQKTIDPYDLDLKTIINRKQWVAQEVANIAIEKSKYLQYILNSDGDEYNYNGKIHRFKRWFTAIISISYDKINNKCLVDYVYIDGDTFSFYTIKNEIDNRL